MKTRLSLRLALMLAVLLTGMSSASAYYDPGVQRWINRDPIQEQGGLNLHSFVQNRPIDAYDAFGLKCIVKITCYLKLSFRQTPALGSPPIVIVLLPSVTITIPADTLFCWYSCIITSVTGTPCPPCVRVGRGAGSRTLRYRYPARTPVWLRPNCPGPFSETIYYD